MIKRRCEDRPDAIFRKHVKNPAALTLCDRWQCFANFLSDLGPAPSPDHVALRLDQNKGYEPGNVTWATRSEAARHAGRPRWYISYQGITMSVSQWARRQGMRPGLLYHRLNRLDWTIERALTQPVQVQRHPPRTRFRQMTIEEMIDRIGEHLAAGLGVQLSLDMLERELRLGRPAEEVSDEDNDSINSIRRIRL